MADISTYLQQILDAIYGEEVRGSIHDALAAMNTESQTATQNASTALTASAHPPEPNSSTGTWWIWDIDENEYVDTHIGSEIPGPDGVGIENITLISGDHSPGTTDTYRITLTDGSTYSIPIWNGRNGEGVGDVLGKTFDLTLDASDWNDGEITVLNNNLVASPAYKYFVSAYDSGRDEYLSCNVQPMDIVTDGSITFSCDTEPSVDIEVSVVRFEFAGDT